MVGQHFFLATSLTRPDLLKKQKKSVSLRVLFKLAFCPNRKLGHSTKKDKIQIVFLFSHPSPAIKVVEWLKIFDVDFYLVWNVPTFERMKSQDFHSVVHNFSSYQQTWEILIF